MKSVKRFIIPALILIISNFLQFGIHGFDIMNQEAAQGVRKLGEVLFVVSIAWAIIVVIRIAKNQLLKNYDISVADNLKSRKVYTQYNILERILIFIVIIISIGIALMLFESVRSVGVSIFASAGIAGLIIGLAAQKALGSILAGLQIAITQPIRLDDVVIVENEWGWIEEINLTYVVVRIWDKRRLVVPSTFFLDRPFQNWTRTSADILGTVFTAMPAKNKGYASGKSCKIIYCFSRHFKRSTASSCSLSTYLASVFSIPTLTVHACSGNV